MLPCQATLAASLTVCAKKVVPERAVELSEASRLLRLCESLARTASALLGSVLEGNKKGDLEVGAHRAAPTAERFAHAADVVAPVVTKKKRHRQKRKKMSVDDGGGAGTRSVDAGLVAGADGGVFRFHGPGPLAASSALGCCAGASTAMDVSGSSSPIPAGGVSFQVGRKAFIANLVARPELNGGGVAIISFDKPSQRYAVKLETTGGCLKVRPDNLRASVFG